MTNIEIFFFEVKYKKFTSVFIKKIIIVKYINVSTVKY